MITAKFAKMFALSISVALGGLIPSLGSETDQPSEPAATPIHVSYVVSPHPDDEFQGWSLVENSPANYKVFIVLTHGEQTNYCEPEPYSRSYQPGLERPATPTPTGRWTTQCGSARRAAQVNFLNDMATKDSTIPGQLQYQGVSDALPANGVNVCRRDSSGTSGSCTVRDRTARVWTAPNGMGALVMFNLGDGDLTQAEVQWAIEAVQDNRSMLGLDATLPDMNIIGASYRNRARTACIQYDHVDHQAVHQALWNVDFGVLHQWGATCASDPDAYRSESVTNARVSDAFHVRGDGKRIGAHVNNYGWLASPYYRIDLSSQVELFHKNQTFWLSPVSR